MSNKGCTQLSFSSSELNLEGNLRTILDVYIWYSPCRYMDGIMAYHVSLQLGKPCICRLNEDKHDDFKTVRQHKREIVNLYTLSFSTRE